MQALDATTKRRMGRKQIIEEPFAIAVSALKRIHNEQVSDTARRIFKGRFRMCNVFEGTEEGARVACKFDG